MTSAQWKKEKKEIEESYENEILKRQKAKRTYDKAIKAAEEKKAKATTDFEKAKAEAIEKLVLESKTNPEKINDALKHLGIEEI